VGRVGISTRQSSSGCIYFCGCGTPITFIFLEIPHVNKLNIWSYGYGDVFGISRNTSCKLNIWSYGYGDVLVVYFRLCISCQII